MARSSFGNMRSADTQRWDSPWPGARPFSGYRTILDTLRLCHEAMIMLQRRQAGHDVSHVSACNTWKRKCSSLTACRSRSAGRATVRKTRAQKTGQPLQELILGPEYHCGPVMVASGLQSP